MTLRVLQENSQIAAAREELVRMGIPPLAPAKSPWRSFLKAFGLGPTMAVGDMVKSWDVLATIKFLASNVKKDAAVLDIGCYASEILVALHRLGYTRLAGVDLNPNLFRMPHQESIRYETSDFMHTPFADGSFQGITSISVMEHGFDGPRLLKEMSRLLGPGGYLITSFDYWPVKIDTTGTRFFGMDWTIFSKDEITKFVADAAKFGLRPAGDLAFDAKDHPIAHGGKEYTFGWLVLQKTA
jgi:SAM-dependent methyltransferase